MKKPTLTAATAPAARVMRTRGRVRFVRRPTRWLARIRGSQPADTGLVTQRPRHSGLRRPRSSGFPQPCRGARRPRAGFLSVRGRAPPPCADAAVGRSASRIASSANSTPMTLDPAARWASSQLTTSRPVQCTQAGRRSVFPRASASGTHGSRGTARQAPTASHVRNRVPRFAPCIGHSGAAMR